MSLGVVLIGLLLRSFPTIAAGPHDTLEAQHEGAIADIAAAHQLAVTIALSQYGKDIHEIMKVMKKRGDLDGYLAARKERSRFETEQTVPETPTDDLPEIAQAQQRYQHSLDKAERERKNKTEKLLECYLKHLNQLVKTLMNEDKIEEAIRVKPEIKKAESILRDLRSRPTSIVLDFRSPLKAKRLLDGFIMSTPKAWQPRRGELQGRKGYLTYATYFKSIRRVEVRGRLVPPSKHNFRMSVGQINLIFNWEVRRQNAYRNGEKCTMQDGDALVPGQVHEIVVENEGEQITVSVDGKTVYTTAGKLHGTVTLYPAFRSTIGVSRIEIAGTPEPERKVSGHSHTNTY